MDVQIGTEEGVRVRENIDEGPDPEVETDAIKDDEADPGKYVHN